MGSSSGALSRGCAASPLFDYVHRDDGAFAWQDTGRTISGGSNATNGWTGFILNLTSQLWLTPADFVGPNGHVWTHQLLVVVPDERPLAFPDAAALWITGGGNGDGDPSAGDEDVLVCASLATTVGVVCSVLYQIPQAPIIFAADPLRAERSEDALVAFTWAQFMLKHNDTPEWISYFPMAKAGIKAMDATEAFVQQRLGLALRRWVTAGASKRGATCWLTGAVGDPRIIGIVPIVFDVLNFRQGVQHMWRTVSAGARARACVRARTHVAPLTHVPSSSSHAFLPSPSLFFQLGNWTFAFTDYRSANVTKYLNDGSNYLDLLAAQLDPLAYAENLTMSKLVVDATGDEFFQPQDDSFWWGQLPGESLRMMVDNAEHSMATGALYLITGAETWLKSLLTGAPRPSFSWTLAVDPDTGAGKITVTVRGALQPTAAVNRMATTLDGYRRDFRLVAGDTPANPCEYIKVPVFGSACLRPIVWIGNTIARVSWDPVNLVSTYVATQDAPAEGWRAFLVELYFPSAIGGLDFQLTTQVHTIAAPGMPLYPFPLCEGDACIGDLV